MQGYSLVHPQSAHFTTIPADAVYTFLQDDERLYCIEDTPQRAFWTYWGDPAFDTPPFGTLCFGDLELQGNDTLLVSGLSDTRMEVLLDLLHPLRRCNWMHFHAWRSLEGKGQRRNAGAYAEQVCVTIRIPDPPNNANHQWPVGSPHRPQYLLAA